jgi:hypothetical protein
VLGSVDRQHVPAPGHAFAVLAIGQQVFYAVER